MKVILILVVILAGFTALTLWRAAQHVTAAEAAYPPTGQLIEVPVNGTPVRVHYVDLGPRAAPPVVLIHGSSGNVRDWTFDMAERLSDRYRVLIFDRPGLGFTDIITPNTPIAAQANLLADATAALGAEQPIVVGHSFGGAVALAGATERPGNLSGLLVLAGASNEWSTGTGLYYTLLSNPITGPIMANLIAAWVPDSTVEASVASAFTPNAMPDGYPAHYGPDLILRPASMFENARQRASLLPQIQAMVPLYADIAVPTEILHGDLDTTVPISVHSEPLSRQIPGANLVVLPGVGHMPHHIAPDQITAAIDRIATAADLR